MDRSLFTAKFKRDYVAASAVVIFFLIVVSEITLAVGIPTYLLRSDIWALQIKRQQLLTSFDTLRRTCNEAQIKDTAADEENKIVLWSLNLMANYLRLHRQGETGEKRQPGNGTQSAAVSQCPHPATGKRFRETRQP